MALAYPFPHPPPPGTTLEVAHGVHWLRMPLPFALDHINLWLIDDGEGFTLVDTGYGDEATRAESARMTPPPRSQARCPPTVRSQFLGAALRN